MTKESGAVAVALPDVPVRVSGYVPGAVPGCTYKTRFAPVELWLVNASLTPAGRFNDRETGPLNPAAGVMVTP